MDKQSFSLSRKKIGILFAVLLLILIPLVTFLISRNSQPKSPQEAPYVANEIIVKYAAGYAPDEVVDEEKKKHIADVLRQAGVLTQRKVFQSNDAKLKQYYLLALKKRSNVKKIQEYINSTDIGSSNPNHIAKAVDVLPNDSLYSYLYGLRKIQLEKAWEITRGSNTVTVAVLDTGIDYNHEDMPKADIINGPDYITCDHYSNDKYDCATGFVKQCPQLAQGYCDNDPMDDYGHGTHVAGTIHSTTNNSIGVAGVNWNVKLMALKVLNAEGSGPESATGDAIRYAADHGANVINMSLASPVSCQGNPKHAWATIYQDAIDYATSKGVTVVVAAANDNVDAAGYAPASCNNVITVGATDLNDKRASFSNYGSYVDLAAPGVNILSVKATNCLSSLCSSTVNGKYANMSGTSMATPHVAGVVALLLAANPKLTPLQIKTCLKNNADPISTDKPLGPRLNAYKVLTACGNIAQPTATPTTVPVIITPTSAPVPATMQISQPPPGSNVVGATVNVVYAASGDLVSAGVNHVHLQMDNNPEVRDTDFDGKYTFTSVPVGQHILKGYLAKADHSKVPGTDVQVSFTTVVDTLTPTTVPGQLTEDVDKDGCVGLLDFNAWFKAIRGTPQANSSPDINKDGSIDIVDFNLWFRAMKNLPPEKLC